MNRQASLAAALAEKRSDRRIDVLRHIQACGSISEAARQVGISYKAAWQALDTLSNLAGVQLVQRSVGGKGGGGAVLTPDALLLLEAADAMVQAREQLSTQLQLAQNQPQSPSDMPRAGISVATTLARLQVVTSMRNQWPCIVESVQDNGPMVVVQMRGAEAGAKQFSVRSHITGESAQLLGLKPGLPVLAMCKATAVVVAADAVDVAGITMAQTPNCWQGSVARATRGGTVQELAVRLGAGVQLVGFSRTATSLRARAKVVVVVEPSSVVIALSGE